MLKYLYGCLLIGYAIVVLAVTYETLTMHAKPGVEHLFVFCPNWVLGFLSGAGFAGLCWLLFRCEPIVDGGGKKTLKKEYVN